LNRRAQSRSGGLFVATAAVLGGLVLLTQLPVMAAPRGYLKGAATPFTAATSAFLDTAGAGIGVVREASRLRNDNDRLRAENGGLRRQLAELQAAGRENEDLRRALQFQKSYGHRTLTAAVIGRAPDGLTRSITIGRGRADGIRPGMVVVSGAGLVGAIAEVSEHSATVRTIVDAESRVNAYLLKSGLEGTVIGEGGPLTMEVMPRPGVVASPGEWAMTSGIGGLYPRGILVGQVAQFHRRDSATQEIAELAPANDFQGVAAVLVITDFTPSG